MQGCASQVWLSRHTGADGRLSYIGDSDAIIVRGLIAVVLALYSGKTPEEISAIDAEKVFQELDLGAHLSSQRSNGLRSMVARIKADARAADDHEEGDDERREVHRPADVASAVLVVGAPGEHPADRVRDDDRGERHDPRLDQVPHHTRLDTRSTTC